MKEKEKEEKKPKKKGGLVLCVSFLICKKPINGFATSPSGLSC